MAISNDLWYRKTNVQVIAIVDIIISTLTFMLFSWNLFHAIIVIKNRKIELLELFALFTSSLLTLVRWLVAKRLITDTNTISEKPKRALRGCRLWRNYSLFLLAIWIFSLTLHFFVSERKDDQLPLIILICEILFRLFAFYYVGLLARDLDILLEPSMKSSDTLHIFPDGESQNTTIIQISDFSESHNSEM